MSTIVIPFVVKNVFDLGFPQIHWFLQENAHLSYTTSAISVTFPREVQVNFLGDRVYYFRPCTWIVLSFQTLSFSERTFGKVSFFPQKTYTFLWTPVGTLYNVRICCTYTFPWDIPFVPSSVLSLPIFDGHQKPTASARKWRAVITTLLIPSGACVEWWPFGRKPNNVRCVSATIMNGNYNNR